MKSSTSIDTTRRQSWSIDAAIWKEQSVILRTFITALLTVYLDRKIRRDAKETDFEGQRVAGLREGMLRLFLDKRLFREALDRIRADRQSGA